MTIVYIALCVSVVGAASIPSRMPAGNLPCFVNDVEGPVTTRTLENYLENIYDRLFDLKSHIEPSLQRMREDYSVDVSDDEIETASFMNVPITNATVDREQFVNSFCTNSTSFVETMREHYEMLNQLANYLQQFNHTVIDMTLSSLTSLMSTQEDVYAVMCSIKITLRSEDRDPVTDVPSGNVSDTFLQAREGSRHTRQMSEYVTLLDSKRLSTYLNTLYDTFTTTGLLC